MALHLRWQRVALIGMIASACVAPLSPAQAQGSIDPQATIQATNGTDYAANELGNPWDMAGSDDIAFEYTRDNGQVSNLRFEGGLLKATSSGNDPRVSILIPTHPQINPLPPEGGYRPISTSFYRYLTVKINISQTSFAMVFWQNALGATYEHTGFQQLSAGANTVTFDLAAGGANSAGAWDGNVQGLYFDPTTTSGVSFEIDSIRLSNTAPNEPNNTPPVLHITAPSYISGPDYATTELGDPWDMSNSADVTATRALGSYNFLNGELVANGQTDNNNCGGGLICGDPQVTLHVGSTINTAKYKYVTYRMKLDGPWDTVNGSVSRFVWWSTKPEQATQTEAWVVYEGYQTVSGNLNTLLLLPGFFATWANSSPKVFRFDPHEFAAARKFYLDYVMLTSDDQARVNSSYSIRYNATDADGNGLSTNFFYAPAGNLQSRTAITCSSSTPAPTQANKVFVPLANNGAQPPTQPSGSSCRWDTTGVSAGTYYIVGVTTDGIDTVTTTSQTAVVLN